MEDSVNPKMKRDVECVPVYFKEDGLTMADLNISLQVIMGFEN